ncbi:DUF2505 domain-containing protein [Photobacterium frigidiphilum]|uniref:DUF2505 domain-containing protein n=1 Tax=Photobacterium frigidiphilum TaxID=264736 RepID=UPI003D0CC40A
MQVSAIHDYQEDLDTILRFFSEEELIIEKYQKLGARNVRIVKIEETEDGFLVETQREVPANVPGMLKSLLGNYNTIKQSETWHWLEGDQLKCEMQVELIGVPAAITGQMLFSEPAAKLKSGPTTRNNVEMTISSSVPFIGSTLVSFICDDIKQQIQTEYEFLLEALPALLTE